MLYTHKGDKGDTGIFGCKQRFSKNSALTEALGSLDELNSLLGLCKVQAQTNADLTQTNAEKINISTIIEQVQQNLFIIQANLAGANKKITQEKISKMEKIINGIEKELPPIKNFFLPGGTETATYLDYARAVVRRTERRVVALLETHKIDNEIIAYLNRLSSLFYAMARFVNFKSEAKETPPTYQ